MGLTDVTLCGKTLCSPVIAASGTFGFGGEYAGIVDMKKLGGISGKGLTLEGKYGNEGASVGDTCRAHQLHRSAESRRAAFH